MNLPKKQPVAPSAYRPAPKIVQPKMGNAAQNRKPPTAPPVYRPQSVHKALQPKIAQSKTSPVQLQANVARQAAPPVYRPQNGLKAVQPKMASGQQANNRPVAPPAYRPQPTPRVLQTKKATSEVAAHPARSTAAIVPHVYKPYGATQAIQPRSSANGGREVQRQQQTRLQAASSHATAPAQGAGNHAAREQHNPATTQGRQLLNHELRNVVQRRASEARNPFGSGAGIAQNRASKTGAAQRMERRAAMQPVVQRQRRTAHHSQRGVIQPLNFGWWFGGQAEADHLDSIFANIGGLKNNIDNTWLNVSGRVNGKLRKNIAKQIAELDKDRLAQQAKKITWTDVTSGASERDLNDLKERARALYTTILGNSSNEADELRRRSRAAFDFYASTLGAQRIADSIAHFGSANNFGDVLEAAQRAGAPTGFMSAFLDACRLRHWPADRAQAYFAEMHGATQQDFANSLTWANDFYTAGNTGTGPVHARPNYKGANGAAVAISATESFNFNRAAPAKVCSVIIAPGDLNHWKCGHTFEQFRLTNANAGRAPFSSMWPRGTNDATILADARAAVGTLRNQIQIQTDADAERAELSTAQNGFTYTVGINHVAGSNHGLYRMVQFFPTAGGPSIPKHILKAFVALF